MRRRDILTGLGSALGMAAAGPAWAAPEAVAAPVTAVRDRLHTLRSGTVPPEIRAHLEQRGLPTDILGQTLASVAATVAFHDLGTNTHPDVEALLREEAPRAGAVSAHWSRLLRAERHPLNDALQARPDW